MQSQGDIDASCQELGTDTLWENLVPTVPGTQNIHCVTPVTDQHIETRFFCADQRPKVHPVIRHPECMLAPAVTPN